MKAEFGEHQKEKKKKRKKRLYKEIGLESLKCSRWFRRLYCFFIKSKLPSYLFNLISSGVHSYNTRNSEDVVTYHCRTETFKYSFFSWTILKWNKLDLTFASVLIKYSEIICLK